MNRLGPLIFFEAIIVVLMWATAILVPLGLIIQVQRTLPAVSRDPSIELKVLASLLLMALELYVRRMLDDLFRGLGFQPYSASRWSHRLYATVWVLWVGVIERAPWIQKQGLLSQLFSLVGDRSPVHRAKLDAPDAKLPAYTYKRLSGVRSIRIITLHRRKDDAATAPITCSMEEVPLDSAPPFVALSYAWDSQEGTQDIVCDGARLTVTKNCVAALRSIREKPFLDEKRVWVDAICINQAATPEKHRQISIMGDIYRGAGSVRVWLGEQDESSSLVCDYFATISGKEGSGRFRGLNRKSEQDPREIGLEMAHQWPQLSKSLVDFFSRSWFTRAWPIQEVTLPRPGRVYVVCGSKRLQLEHLRVGWNLLRELEVLPVSALHDQPVALQFYLADAIALKRGLVPSSERRLVRTRNSQLNLGKPLLADLSQFSFTRVMHAMRFKACRDAKDRFFSLYGVFEELEIDHGVPISTWTQTDADVFRAVALACFKLDGHLGALRLAQLPDPYLRLSDYVLLSARRNPYDGLSTSMFAMTGRVLSVARNLAARREVFYHAPTSVWRKALPSWAPDWTLPIPAHVDAERQISLIDAAAGASPKNEDPDEAVAVPVLDGPRLVVEVKIVGRITDLGTVDSAGLLWQVLSSGSMLSSFQRHPNNVNDTLNPTLSALAETVYNHVWRSHMAQILVSLRMAVRNIGFFDLWAIASAGYTSVYFRSRIYELLCNRFPSVASCPTDGAGMRTRLHQLEKIQSYSEVHAISQAFGVFLHGRSYINSDMWHQSAADLSFIVGGLLWDFRVSLLETLFGTRYEHIDWVLAFPILGLLISDTVQTVAVWIGDTPIYLLAWSLGVAAKLGFLLTVLVWAWRIRVLHLLVILIVAPRLVRGPVRFLRSLFGAARFRKPGAYTHGAHFFVTDTGLPGSTSSPVLRDDRLAKVRGSKGCLLLRPNGEHGGCNDGYVVVGAAHVGTQDLLDHILADEAWSRIEIC